MFTCGFDLRSRGTRREVTFATLKSSTLKSSREDFNRAQILRPPQTVAARARLLNKWRGTCRYVK